MVTIRSVYCHSFTNLDLKIYSRALTALSVGPKVTLKVDQTHRKTISAKIIRKTKILLKERVLRRMRRTRTIL
jgi:hypothetical protein